MEIDGLQCDKDELVELELDFDEETMEILEDLAKMEGVTVDQLVNDTLTKILDELDENSSGSKTL